MTTAATAPEVGSAESPSEAVAALPQVLKFVGSVVAPTSLLTALMFYFGWLYTIVFFRYFGVNFTVLDLPFQEYLTLSADGLIIPLIYAAGATLMVIWLYQLPLRTRSAGFRRTVLRALMPLVAIAGLILVILAMASAVLAIPVFPQSVPEAQGLSLSIGVLLVAYAARLRWLATPERGSRQPPRQAPDTVVVAKWGAVFILVSIGLFWAIGEYAIGVGEGRAQVFAADLAFAPDVVLYSEKSQNLQIPGIREVICQNPDTGYRFRYDGLKLVPQSGSHYLFLPADWTYSDGVAILLPRSEELRLEFSHSGQVVRDVTC